MLRCLGGAAAAIPLRGLWAAPQAAGDLLQVKSAEYALAQIGSRSVRDALPPTLFGFNMEFFEFQDDFTEAVTADPRAEVVQALKVFPGAIYRYPGGLVANAFDWEASLGSLHARPARRSVKWAPAGSVRFGVDEYLRFVKAVGGRPWYVLNLLGWDAEQPIRELPSTEIAAKNRRLAQHLLRNWPDPALPRYYQLGNELDRSEYEWPVEKYIARSLDTIRAIQQVDPGARFVAFLRDFDWSYKSRAGKSRFGDFIREVMSALPMVNDFSLHMYYDAVGEEGGKTDIPWRMERFKAAMDIVGSTRRGELPGLWITEHARALSKRQKTAAVRHQFTSGLAGAIGTADFMITAAQMPQVQGACWHSLGGVYWKLFEQDLTPTPVYQALALLRRLGLPRVLETHNASPHRAGYAGGYDVRSVAFTDEAGQRLGLWVVNRSNRETVLEIQYVRWAGSAVSIRHDFLGGEAGADPEQIRPMLVKNKRLAGRFAPSGALRVNLPPASVSTFLLEAG